MFNKIDESFKKAYLKVIKEDIGTFPTEASEVEAPIGGDEADIKLVTFKTSDKNLIDAINSGFDEVVFFVKAKDEITGEDTVTEVKFGPEAFAELSVTDAEIGPEEDEGGAESEETQLNECGENIAGEEEEVTEEDEEGAEGDEQEVTNEEDEESQLNECGEISEEDEQEDVTNEEDEQEVTNEEDEKCPDCGESPCKCEEAKGLSNESKKMNRFYEVYRSVISSIK